MLLEHLVFFFFNNFIVVQPVDSQLAYTKSELSCDFKNHDAISFHNQDIEVLCIENFS